MRFKLFTAVAATLIFTSGVFGQRTTKPAAKKVVSVESPEHAYIREKLKARQFLYDGWPTEEELFPELKLQHVLEESTLCVSDKAIWLNCSQKIPAAMKEAVKALCPNIGPLDPANSCLIIVKERLNDHDLLLKRLADGEQKNTVLADIDRLKERLELVDPCLRLYRTTIDKKVSDLTTRETEQIPACRSLDLYPPRK
jgi:hypothetical protein